jgi:hypothetical protein
MRTRARVCVCVFPPGRMGSGREGGRAGGLRSHRQARAALLDLLHPAQREVDQPECRVGVPRERAAWACRVGAAAWARLLVSSFARSSAAASLFGACRVDVCAAECVETRSLSITRSRSSIIA